MTALLNATNSTSYAESGLQLPVNGRSRFTQQGIRKDALFFWAGEGIPEQILKDQRPESADRMISPAVLSPFFLVPLLGQKKFATMRGIPPPARPP